MSTTQLLWRQITRHLRDLKASLGNNKTSLKKENYEIALKRKINKVALK